MSRSCKNEAELIPFEEIAKAVNGDLNAILRIVDHYYEYINVKCQRQTFDAKGKCRYYIDPDMRRDVELRLMRAIGRFDLTKYKK